MGRRDELEKQLDVIQARIEQAPDNVPDDLLEAWHKEMDSIFFELDNLYDDDEMEYE